MLEPFYFSLPRVEGPRLTAIKECGGDTGIVLCHRGVGSEFIPFSHTLFVSPARAVDALPIRRCLQ